MKTMPSLSKYLTSLMLLLAACSPTPRLTAAPEPAAAVIPTVVMPAATRTVPPPATATAVKHGGPFEKISRSTNVLHLKCDPLEIIFDVTVNSPEVKSVVFFFRMKDTATGIVNNWSNGENMRPAGGGIYEFIFRASAIPDEARYKKAWVQYQFAAVDSKLTILGQSRIYANELVFTPDCP